MMADFRGIKTVRPSTCGHGKTGENGANVCGRDYLLHARHFIGALTMPT